MGLLCLGSALGSAALVGCETNSVTSPDAGVFNSLLNELSFAVVGDLPAAGSEASQQLSAESEAIQRLMNEAIEKANADGTPVEFRIVAGDVTAPRIEGIPGGMQAPMEPQPTPVEPQAEPESSAED